MCPWTSRVARRWWLPRVSPVAVPEAAAPQAGAVAQPHCADRLRVCARNRCATTKRCVLRRQLAKHYAFRRLLNTGLSTERRTDGRLCALQRPLNSAGFQFHPYRDLHHRDHYPGPGDSGVSQYTGRNSAHHQHYAGDALSVRRHHQPCQSLCCERRGHGCAPAHFDLRQSIQVDGNGQITGQVTPVLPTSLR